MPNTTTAAWVEAVTGRKARASEVNGNFDYSEHSLWPHSTGTKVTNAYYLGDTDAAWRGVYTYSLDPLGSTGIAIGTTTVANASSTSLELGGAKAFLLPRLTTTQRDNLTAVSGMYIFNTTADRTELYRNGAWEGNDVPIGIVNKTRFFVSTAGSQYTTITSAIVSASGSGRVLQVILDGVGGQGGGGTTSVFEVTVTIDSVTATYSGNTTTAFPVYLTRTDGLTTTSLDFTTGVATLDVFFKNQFLVTGQSLFGGGGTNSAFAFYESS